MAEKTHKTPTAAPKATKAQAGAASSAPPAAAAPAPSPSVQDKPLSRQVAQTLRTGVGSTLKVCMEASATRAKQQFTVEYQDVQGYFAGAGTILAYAKCTGSTAGADGATKKMLPKEVAERQGWVKLMRQASGTYVGAVGFEMSPQERLEALEFAFHDGSGKWDSNWGWNYTVPMT